MSRSNWWSQQYFNHVAGVSQLPVLSNLKISLHTGVDSLIDNNTNTVDSFTDELIFSDYSRKNIYFNNTTRSSTIDILWGVSIADWNNIAAIGITGSCLVGNVVYSKCIWYKILTPPISKPKEQVLFIPKDDLFFE